jgi:hypothetical protein
MSLTTHARGETDATRRGFCASESGQNEPGRRCHTVRVGVSTTVSDHVSTGDRGRIPKGGVHSTHVMSGLAFGR